MRLAIIIPDLLRESIRLGGSTVSDFKRPDGSQGRAQTIHMAYARVGQRCKRKGCKDTIVRIEQNGRATFFCPSCQGE